MTKDVFLSRFLSRALDAVRPWRTGESGFEHSQSGWQYACVALQHCCDPLYLLFGRYAVALKYQYTTALFVEVLEVQEA